MLASDFLDAADRLPRAGLADLLGPGGAVVVAPHPDDESLGCGGLIALAAAEGRALRVVMVSDGVGSHPNSRTHPPERLRALREDEARAAVAALGADPACLAFLRLPDRFVPDQGPEADRASALIAEALEAALAGALFVTWRHDPHCDHQAAYALARAAQGLRSGTRLFEYSVWGRSLPPGAEVAGRPAGLRLDVSAALGAKAAAIACHRSQLTGLIADDPDAFRLDPAMLERFARADEVFLELDP